MSVSINDFALRHTKDSKFSYFDGTIEELCGLVEQFIKQAKPSGRPGVMLVPVPVWRFYTGVVEVQPETALVATCSARREGEAPYIQVEALGAEKLPAKYVEIVIYSHEVLGPDASSPADWEIVSINARPTLDEEPPTPMAMARNFLELPGGTKAAYSAEEFARSIVYWSNRAMCG